MPVSRLDTFYRKLILNSFFSKGWGKPDNLIRLLQWRKQLSNRDICQHMVASDYPIHIDKEYRDGDVRIMEGHFKSPFVDQLPGVMPKESETATFQAILPLNWQHQKIKPICIHLAGTGDHGFWRRRTFTAKPLLREAGIASILIENPFYGSRKPRDQFRSGLLNVSDLFVMGSGLVLESLAMLHWCEKQRWGPLGLSGVSMGGFMASMTATNWHKPISLVPILSWSTASQVFTQGVLSGSIPWKTLEAQFFENSTYQNEVRKLIVSPETNRSSNKVGKSFVKAMENLSESQLRTPPSASLLNDRLLKKSPLSSGSSDIGSVSQSGQGVGKSDLDHKETVLKSDNVLSVASPTESFNHDFIDTSSSSAKDISNSSGKSTVLSQTKVSSEPEQSKSTSSVMSETKSIKKLSKRELYKSLTLSYAKSKGGQLTKSFSDSKRKVSGGLTLGHANAKSKITQGHNLPLDKEGLQTLKSESLDFMCGVMDECTHLGNYSMPVDPELIIIIKATQDAYIIAEDVLGLDELWPGSEVRYVNQGHVGAVLLHQAMFRKAVVDSFNKQIQKYHSGSEIRSVNVVQPSIQYKDLRREIEKDLNSQKEREKKELKEWLKT